MNIIEIITKKVNKHELNKEEISFFVEEYLNGNIKPYQISSLLMAIKLNGMSDNETINLTNTLKNSGSLIDLSEINDIVLDKHSTGGVGDKTTLILTPIVASLGGKIAKMSGKSLGYTGGTIDKLDSIKGFNTNLTIKQFIENIKKHGLSIISQSKEIAPADGKLYALRDVTGTISSIPLIVSSIMSKKLATGSDAILLDVKCGDGAFVSNIDDATILANKMILIGKSFNKDIRAYITDMSVPLGRAIGNKIEVLEVIEFLNGNYDKKLHTLIINLASTLLMQAKIYKDKNQAIKDINESINSKKALNKFYEFIKSQGGDLEHLNSQKFFNPKHKYEIKATINGYMDISSALEFGIASSNLGAGRKEKEDIIDNEAGIYINKKSGEEVKINDVLITLYSSNLIPKYIIENLKKAYKIVQFSVNKEIILKEIK